MRKICVISCMIALITVSIVSFKKGNNTELYKSSYTKKLDQFRGQAIQLIQTIEGSNIHNEGDVEKIRSGINKLRDELKGMDFWFRYLEPTVYKRVNGPLPVEWETEVFEKFEKPYKREGAGLTLAALYTEEENFRKDSLIQLTKAALEATDTYAADSITKELKTFHHFFLCNRLFLLNLATIYTTGFECPDTTRVIPELRQMMNDVRGIYTDYNESFPATPLTGNYLSLYEEAITFVNRQPDNFTSFDHFSFIKQYVNPLFGLNQQAITDYRVRSRSFVDYSLNKSPRSIFDKELYNGLNPKGIFLRVDDEKVLAQIDQVGKLLYYDPILSKNNKRSCVSCHKPTEYFTDTISIVPQEFDQHALLPRNTPSLVNVVYNHLAMMDGKHISLQDQARAVITNPHEMGSDENTVLQKVLSCTDYKKTFKELLKYTPQETEITFEHIASAITWYYSKFSRYYAPFDEAMNTEQALPDNAKRGFNLFMSKAQCATCHFVPQFNGVKPPFIGSEFEVLGVPEDTSFSRLSDDKGRYDVNPAEETLNAFRTGSLRNSMHTGPYMHNGVFKTMRQVVDFYDAGGGSGRGLLVANQTLSSDSLHLAYAEKEDIIHFIQTLDEKIRFEAPPAKLPHSKIKDLNRRKVGGEY